MRLEKIRLAGFKSFVDPTTVTFPSNLIGIVGPNGCGKSNVIDAVRWVMGESSARLLRGEAMTDVIFNGSSGRQPLTSASIELVFDNRDRRAGGAYAAFPQLSVKRHLSRDGQSNYFLNGVRCRRRDIQELFLGTGLGPRSYAIIEQGMISRFIEARPDELRIFLEEAAGISKYKERRRETETRIEHTRANLTRLDDLRAEVNTQLHHLERQVQQAEQFNQLQADAVRLEQELIALRWHALIGEAQHYAQQLDNLNASSADTSARQHQLETDLTAQRHAHQTAVAHIAAVQTQSYAVNAEIAQLEQALAFADDLQRQHRADLDELTLTLAATTAHLDAEQRRHAALVAALASDEPAWQQAEQELTAASVAVAAAENQLRAWETHWDEFNHAAAAPAAEAQSARANLTALEQQLVRDESRQRRLHDEHQRLQDDDAEAEMAALVTAEADCDEQQAALALALQSHADDLAAHEATVQHLTTALDHLRGGLQESKGRLASLVALQDAALAAPDAAHADWLAGAGLAHAPNLINHLQVAPGWKVATETVLGAALRAVATPALTSHCRASTPLPPGLTLIDAQAVNTAPAAPTTLATQVRTDWAVSDFWHGVRLAEDVSTALEQRMTLAAGECFVTPDGVRVGRHWLQTPPAVTGGGVLARAEAIATLRQMIGDGVAWEAKLVTELTAARAARVAAEHARSALEQQQLVLAQEQARVRVLLSNLRARYGHQQERLTALAAELAELTQQLAEVQAQSVDTRERLYDLLTEVEALAEQRGILLNERDQRRDELAQARTLEQQCRDRAQNLRVTLESHRVALEALTQTVARAEEQQRQLLARQEVLLAAQATQLAPLLEQEERLAQQRVVQTDLVQVLQVATQEREALELALRALEEEQLQIAQTTLVHQQQLDNVRSAQQERLVRAQTLAEQLAEMGVEPLPLATQALAAPPPLPKGGEEVLTGDSAGASAEADELSFEWRWRGALARVRARLQRLGAVNLAAVTEYQELVTRKGYLDTQHADIAAALATLAQAIRKIDRDTRHRFRETFERVNQEFQQLFPQLFGGGEAQLELTEGDLLEAGVRVLARPPGKRNATIHLLSGGEKALTAIALVFAIFQLNPAPFCLLDEVDAPLDDANVARFGALVQALSARVQLIFISHNRLTMEVAEHLIGVTMHEPGVSRVVAVDMATAVALTTAP